MNVDAAGKDANLDFNNANHNQNVPQIILT
jgi:hypothetical protein